jgi:hypothetical protein
MPLVDHTDTVLVVVDGQEGFDGGDLPRTKWPGRAKP